MEAVQPAEARLRVSIAIPTYRREAVLVQTLEYLLALSVRADEILVLDQTETHQPPTILALEAMVAAYQIRWVRLAVPSIPAAMNAGLQQAKGEVVLFLDDDIRPEADLVLAHRSAHADREASTLIAGRVIQPWEEGVDLSSDKNFRFAGVHSAWISEFMGGNFSVRRSTALALGGFDENFVRVAYRFEAEFAHRFCASGRPIWFEPTACLHHLKDASGGTRTYGEHLTTWRPDHAVGAYYFALRTGAWRELLTRPFRSVMTRFHLRRPWRVVGTLWAEARGLLWALRLRASGPRYVAPTEQRQL